MSNKGAECERENEYKTRPNIFRRPDHKTPQHTTPHHQHIPRAMETIDSVSLSSDKGKPNAPREPTVTSVRWMKPAQRWRGRRRRQAARRRRRARRPPSTSTPVGQVTDEQGGDRPRRYRRCRRRAFEGDREGGGGRRRPGGGGEKGRPPAASRAAARWRPRRRRRSRAPRPTPRRPLAGRATRRSPGRSPSSAPTRRLRLRPERLRRLLRPRRRRQGMRARGRPAAAARHLRRQALRCPRLSGGRCAVEEVRVGRVTARACAPFPSSPVILAPAPGCARSRTLRVRRRRGAGATRRRCSATAPRRWTARCGRCSPSPPSCKPARRMCPEGALRNATRAAFAPGGSLLQLLLCITRRAESGDAAAHASWAQTHQPCPHAPVGANASFGVRLLDLRSASASARSFGVAWLLLRPRRSRRCTAGGRRRWRGGPRRGAAAHPRRLLRRRDGDRGLLLPRRGDALRVGHPGGTAAAILSNRVDGRRPARTLAAYRAPCTRARRQNARGGVRRVRRRRPRSDRRARRHRRRDAAPRARRRWATRSASARRQRRSSSR